MLRLITLALLLGAPFLIGAHARRVCPTCGATARGFLVRRPRVDSSAAWRNFSIYTPMLGAGGGYLAFITGNLINMKIPCAVNARDMVGRQDRHAGKRDHLHALDRHVVARDDRHSGARRARCSSRCSRCCSRPALQPAFDNVVPALFGAMAYKYYRKNIEDRASAPLVVMSVLFMLVPGLISARPAL